MPPRRGFLVLLSPLPTPHSGLKLSVGRTRVIWRLHQAEQKADEVGKLGG